jgi:secretion/DNA translocation related TadE-like protein
MTPRVRLRPQRGERGAVSILMLAAVGIAVVLCLGIGRVGGAAVLQARAETAADAAALAGADALALGHRPADALRAARSAAALNQARLVSCTCAGRAAEVVVQTGRAHGHARAVVDLSGISRLGS